VRVVIRNQQAVAILPRFDEYRNVAIFQPDATLEATQTAQRFSVHHETPEHASRHLVHQNPSFHLAKVPPFQYLPQ
jgi:hypothetical protein